MRTFALTLYLLAFRSAAEAQEAQPPPGVIFDTDMGDAVNDALAPAVLHSIDGRREIRLLAVTVTKDDKWAAPSIDAVNTFYEEFRKRRHITPGILC